MSAQQLPPPVQMMQMVMGSWVAQAVGAAARLSLADGLADGPRTAEELAAQAGANADAVFRLLRALASLGVFAFDGARFSLTPLGNTLRSGVPGSMKNIAMAETDTAHWLCWGRFIDAVKTGKAVAQDALGMAPWQYYAAHPEDGEQFSRAMADISGIAIQPVLETYDFSSASTIVDVGGAHGALLSAILSKHADIRGILFDLPHVAATAKSAIAAAGLASRVEIVEGDFFKAVPAGGDLYLLKHILHDWDDERCITLLRSVRAAMNASSKVLIVEMALPDSAAPTPAHWLDLNMLVCLDGRERTPAQYGELLARAGLTMTRFLPTQSPMGLVEAARS